MSNFVKPASITDPKKVRKDAQALGAVDVQQTLTLFSIHKIDFGKGARREIGNQEATTNLDELKTEFKLCYQEMTLYLQKNLPYKQKVLKDLQYIHKSNRLKEEAVPAIRHLATKIAHVLRGTSFTDLNSDRYTDAIVQQFKIYQTESIDVDPKLDSYSYWCFIGEMLDQQGQPKFGELTKLAKTYLSLSHGNSDPERGFSLNKNVLQGREQLKEDTITAIRMVKDAISLYDKVEDFPINKRLMDLCASSRKKYFLHLDVEKQQRQLVAKETQKEIEKRDKQKKKTEKLTEIRKLENQIVEENLKLKVADELIDEGNKSLSALLLGQGKLDKTSVIKAQMVLNAGIEKSKGINAVIKDLEQKIKNISA